MNATNEFARHFAACPLIAILRGVKPDEAVAIGETLLAEGMRIIEVPLNSPAPFESIKRLVKALRGRAMIGAGTVMSAAEVEELARLGAGLVLSPHFDPAVVHASRAAGLVSVPGVLSPTEAFRALQAGASALKLFPMEIIGEKGVKALRAVLPTDICLLGVGGIDETNMCSLKAAGCQGFGLGSSLFKPGMTPEAVAVRGRRLIAALA